MDNDYDVLAALYALLPNSLKSRIWLVSDKLSAAQYKYIISQCAAFTASRTHASIAAYSTGVPCLAIGYSVKAAGIARDLAMNEYVVEVLDVRAEDDLPIRFRHMLQLIGL